MNMTLINGFLIIYIPILILNTIHTKFKKYRNVCQQKICGFQIILDHGIIVQMKKIELICIGDLKFKGLKEVEQMYIDKINYFSKLGIRKLKDVKNQDEKIKIKKEGQMILSVLEKRDFVIALDQYGKKMDSITFSHLISDKIINYPHRIVFLIGGHAGLSKELDPYINLKISFSDMAFAHDIFRILFLEQLYRAFTIIKKIKYHR
jgi:23S rRNA (pseudouridine1915-N3)-methyltransferase